MSKNRSRLLAGLTLAAIGSLSLAMPAIADDSPPSAPAVSDNVSAPVDVTNTAEVPADAIAPQTEPGEATEVTAQDPVPSSTAPPTGATSENAAPPIAPSGESDQPDATVVPPDAGAQVLLVTRGAWAD